MPVLYIVQSHLILPTGEIISEQFFGHERATPIFPSSFTQSYPTPN